MLGVALSSVKRMFNESYRPQRRLNLPRQPSPPTGRNAGPLWSQDPKGWGCAASYLHLETEIMPVKSLHNV